MSKRKKGRASASAKPRRKSAKVWYGILAVIVLAGLTFTYVGADRESSSASEQKSEELTQTTTSATSPALRNRLVLPAGPQKPRPWTLSPNSFSDPEVARSYQVAREIPEVLEHMPCYCGCYASSGHRNNLDCFVDNHGAT